jgi:hypothetical protein
MARNQRTVAAVELTPNGVKRIVLVARDEAEMADVYRMLARATPALHELERAIKEPEAKEQTVSKRD